MGRRFWQGKTVVVTGGSRGLGLELARCAAARGANLALLARDPQQLERATQDPAFRKVRVLSVSCDVGSDTAVRRAVRKVVEVFGGIDVVINNAGVIQTGPLLHMEADDFRNSLHVHFWGPLHTTFAVVPIMEERGGGVIVNISSIGGKVAVPHLLPYSAGKFALAGFSQGLYSELKPKGVSVISVFPGLMRTGSPVNAWFKGEHRKEYLWFAVGDSLPLLSMNAARAARKILRAAEAGKPHVVLGLPAKAAVFANAIFPNTVMRILALVNRALPKETGIQGNVPRRGWQSESRASKAGVTRLSRKASMRNHEYRAPR